MNKSILFGLLVLSFGMFLILGCGNQMTVSDYYSVYANNTSDNATVVYSVISGDNSIPSGYSLNQTLPTISLSLETLAKDNYSQAILPSINFTSMKVSYTVVGDTNSVVGTWTPSGLETGVALNIPGASSGGTSGTTGSSESGAPSSSVTVTLNNIATAALARQVFAKIGSITPIVNGSGSYLFKIALSTALTIQANVTLTGTDDRNKPVTLTFPVTITFDTKTTT